MSGALRSKPWVIAATALAILSLFYLAIPANTYVPSLASLHKPRPHPAYPTVCEQPLNGSAWDYDPERDERNLGLTDEQCQVGVFSCARADVLIFLYRSPSPSNSPRLSGLDDITSRKVASSKTRSSSGHRNPTKPTASSSSLSTMAISTSWAKSLVWSIEGDIFTALL
jgi:hypothetical protein